MTREEAAAYLRPIMENATLPRYQEALWLAVEALEARVGGTPEGCEYCLDYRLPGAYCLFCGRPLTEEAGAALILWTCRQGPYLAKAVNACRLWGLVFDAVNENLLERIEAYGNDCRKISADEYWDDKSVRLEWGREA